MRRDSRHSIHAQPTATIVNSSLSRWPNSLPCVPTHRLSMCTLCRIDSSPLPLPSAHRSHSSLTDTSAIATDAQTTNWTGPRSALSLQPPPTVAMASQGASLQSYNQELVKCLEDLREKREILNKTVRAATLWTMRKRGHSRHPLPAGAAQRAATVGTPICAALIRSFVRACVVVLFVADRR